jgi:hypothetical protein
MQRGGRLAYTGFMSDQPLSANDFPSCDDPEAEAMYWRGVIDHLFRHPEPSPEKLKAAFKAEVSGEKTDPTK